MIDLTPIKIKVTKDQDGRFIYPQFKNLQYFKDNPEYKSESLLYDKVSDCKTHTEDSPIGMRWCAKLVPIEFAQQAIIAFPDTVFAMTDNEAEEFYNNRVTFYSPEKNYNNDILISLQTELSLKKSLNQDTTELEAEIAKAIDPNDSTPGITINQDKTWTSYKEKNNINIVSLALIE